MWSSSDVSWQPSIDFSVFACCSPCQPSKNFRAEVKSRHHRKKVLSPCYSWMRKRIDLLHIPALIKHQKGIVKCCRSGFLMPELFKNGCAYASITRPSNCSKASLLRDHLIEEPWLDQPLISHPLADESDVPKDFLNYYNGTKTGQHNDLFLSYYPVEEPWLLESSSGNESSSIENKSIQPELNNQHLTISDLLHKEESSGMSEEDDISTVILINSSICTMQRIAVLENNELVELLLEPVKNNVQCDSVYVGIVMKLVPHMSGAFVNIGSTRLSFMDLNPNKEPFILRPFHGHLKEKENRTAYESSGMESDIYESMAYSGDEELDSVDDDHSEDEFTDEGSKDNENISDADFSKVINVNGSIVGLGRDSHLERSVEPLDRDLDQLQSKNVKHDGVKVRGTEESASGQVRNGSKIIVQVVKEGMGTKGPAVTPYPKLRSRFWVLISRCNRIGISKKISGLERTRLRVIAKTLQPPGFGLTVRTVASGHSLEELQKDLEGLLSTWKSIVDNAKSAALAADEGVDGAVPVLLHRAMGQTLSVVQDYFNEKVKSMIVDSPRTYHEVTKYLQDIAPSLCDRVELYPKRTPLFDEYNIEAEINNMLSKRVPLANGGSLVIEQTEALVSIDVNGGQCMLGQGTSQENAILEVNLVAAKQIARELRLRDIGGLIVVDFIDMLDDSNKRLVYEEIKKAVERDRSTVRVSELSRHGLMEITRKRVRPSVTFMISEPCTCCHGTGRVEALETSFSKIEHEICRLLSMMNQKAEPEDPKSWPRFILNVDRHMCTYLTSGKKTRLAVLSSSLKVWILLKVARGLTRGAYELKSLTDDNTTHKNQHPVPISVLRPKEVVTYAAPSRDVPLFPIKKSKTGGK